MKCFIGAGLLSATLLCGCSDDREPIPTPAEAGARADAGVATDAGATDDVSSDTSIADAGPIDLFDVIPLGDAGCPACIRDRCGAQINACFNNPACATGLVCTLQMCAAGLLGGDGGYTPTDLLCVLNCFNGDQATAFMAIGSLTCLTMTCAGSCNFAGDAAAIDVRPNPDVTTQPDAREDGLPEDASDATSTPDVGTDVNDNSDGDGAVPADDAARDVTPDTGSWVDTGSAADTASDLAPPGDDGGAD